jgi:hypothetical protein
MKRTAEFSAEIADVKTLKNTANGNAMFEITLSEGVGLAKFIGERLGRAPRTVAVPYENYYVLKHQDLLQPIQRRTELHVCLRTRADYSVNCMIGTHLIGKRVWLKVSQPRKNLLLDDMIITD